MRFIETAAAASDVSGAYVLLMRLEAPLAVRYGGRAASLPAGDYLYCGSARGPGGLRARLARHMRREKRAHWHIDQLTALATILGAFVEEGGDECALNAELAALPIPAPGFGSSDCRYCVSHLRFLPKGDVLPKGWPRGFWPPFPAAKSLSPPA